MTSAQKTPEPKDVTVRHTPLTAMESPRATPQRTFEAATLRAPALPAGGMETTVPTSSTIPVNIVTHRPYRWNR
jgi:hypothetical protein